MSRSAFAEQIILLILVTKLCLKIEAIKDYWCSEEHCKNCGKSEFFECSKNALSTTCGDLCGCCQSCVQFRDFDESCGSQLAVRSPVDNIFGHSIETRISILATTNCKRGLICIDFICQRKDNKIGVKFHDSKFAKPASITLIREIMFNPGCQKNKVFTNLEAITSTKNSSAYKSQDFQFDNLNNSENRFSRRVLNLVINDKEYQLIYSREALVDLKVLLNSIEKTHSNSIVTEIEAKTIYEKFKNILNPTNYTNSGSVGKEGIILLSKTLNLEKNSKKEDTKYFKHNNHQNLLFFNSNTGNNEIQRSKRETGNVKKSKDYSELELKNSDQLNNKKIRNPDSQINDRTNEDFLSLDYLKKVPKIMKNLDHLLITRQVDAKIQETDLGNMESVTNIHVNRMFEDNLKDDKNEEAYQSYDEDFEIFATEESKDFENVTNLVGFEVPVIKSFDNDTKSFIFLNDTTKCSKSKFPINSQNNFLHNLLTGVNETTKEFRTRLAKIETTVVTIGNWIYQIFSSSEKFGINEKSENPQISTYSNANFVDEGQVEMNIFQNPGYREENQYFGTNGKSKRSRLSPGNSKDSSGHRQWRTLMVEPSLDEAHKNLRTLRRSNRTRSLKMNPTSESNSNKNKITNLLSRKNSQSSTESSLMKKLVSDDTKSLAASNYRILPKLFADQQSTSDGSSLNRFLESNQRRLWPLNRGWKGIIDFDRNKRVQIPVDDFFDMETQISKPIQSGISRFDDYPLRGSSGRLKSLEEKMSSQFGDADDISWDNWEVAPSFNLFVVDGQTSDIGSSGFGKSPGNNPQPINNYRLGKVLHNDDNLDRIYPEYLDYNEKVEDKVDQDIVQMETTEAPDKNPRTRRVDPKLTRRKKRSLENNFQENKNKLAGFDSQDILNIDEFNDLGTAESVDSQKFNNLREMKASEKSKKRFRRGVQMVDWLRAAQEYHERLNQVKKAALKTWLASRDEIEDTNLTNVKLFTQEIPAYLEKYTPGYIIDKPEDSNQLISSAAEINENISNRSPQSEVHSKDTSKRSLEESAEISSSSLPRKFTIVTTGNSTIRIEEMPKYEDKTLFEDQSVQSTDNRDFIRTRFRDFLTKDSEDFDHMYESFDTEDEDFDYDDMTFTMSRLVDDADIIEDPEDYEETSKDFFNNDNEDVDFAEIFTRTKRDSPFFLFKVRDNPSQEVLVWPSNWKDLISRHLKVNRSLSTKPPKSIRRMKILKMKPQSLDIDDQNFYSRGITKKTNRHEDDEQDLVDLEDVNKKINHRGNRRWK